MNKNLVREHTVVVLRGVAQLRLNRHVSQFRKIKCNLFNRKIDVYVFHVVTDTVKELMCGGNICELIPPERDVYS